MNAIKDPLNVKKRLLMLGLYPIINLLIGLSNNIFKTNDCKCLGLTCPFLLGFSMKAILHSPHIYRYQCHAGTEEFGDLAQTDENIFL